ncbi:MAG: hypothetical protein RLN70_12040, partial [Rhodospirillaceae bacterium]
QFLGLSTDLVGIPGINGVLPTSFGNAFNTLTSPLGIGAGFAGSILSGLISTPRQGPGNEIGGLLGSAAGSFGGPLGTFVGSFVGSLLGGLIGARPSDRTEGNNVNLQTGVITPGDLGPNKDSPANRRAADALTNAVLQFQSLLQATGATVTAQNLLVEAGSRDGNFRVAIGEHKKTFATAEAAFEHLANRLIDSLAGIPPEFQDAIDNIDLDNLDAFSETIARLSSFEATMQGIRERIAFLEDPKQFALDQLDAQFDIIRAEAIALGKDLADIEKLHGLERKEILDRFNQDIAQGFEDTADEVAAAQGRIRSLILDQANLEADILSNQISDARTLQSFMARASAGLRGAITRLDLDPRFANPSQRFSEAQRLFEDTRTRALLGDQDAIDAIDDLGFTFLDIAQANFGSTSEFIDIQKRVRGTFEDVLGVTTRQEGIASKQLTVLEAQLAELRRISGGGAGEDGVLPASLVDFQALQAEFAAAGSPDPSAGGAFKVFENALLDLIGRADASAIPFLKESFAFQSDRLSDPNNPFLSSAKIVAPALAAALKRLNVPGFESGGMHFGGLRLVGESGPELEATGPSRLFSPDQTADVLSRALMAGRSGAPLSESTLRELRALLTVAKANTFETAQVNEQVLRLNQRMDKLAKAIEGLLARSPQLNSSGQRAA